MMNVILCRNNDVISFFGNVQDKVLKTFFFTMLWILKVKGSGNCQKDYFGSSTIKFI